MVSALGYTPPTTDTKYTHPSTHPASMITGLASAVSSLGYGYCISGISSVATNSSISVSTPFTPTIAISYVNDNETVCIGSSVYNRSLSISGGNNTSSDTRISFSSNYVSFSTRSYATSSIAYVIFGY